MGALRQRWRAEVIGEVWSRVNHVGIPTSVIVDVVITHSLSLPVVTLTPLSGAIPSGPLLLPPKTLRNDWNISPVLRLSAQRRHGRGEEQCMRIALPSCIGLVT